MRQQLQANTRGVPPLRWRVGNNDNDSDNGDNDNDDNDEGEARTRVTTQVGASEGGQGLVLLLLEYTTVAQDLYALQLIFYYCTRDSLGSEEIQKTS